MSGPMPKGIKATEKDIGRKVVYRTAPNYEPEEGVITSIGRIGNVFVRYGSGNTSASTDMNDLDWMIV
jgi:hypothetical protein